MTDPVACLTDFGSADPWGRQVLITALGAALVWFVSILPLLRGVGPHSDPSIVDRLWSIQPILYVWHFYLSGPRENYRLLGMALVVTIWGARLTYNFILKGGYSGGEDYRWAEVRSWFGGPGWRSSHLGLGLGLGLGSEAPGGGSPSHTWPA